MDQIKIGQFLKSLRMDKHLTQEQLGEVLHVSSRTISRWETGTNMPDISMLVELANYFSVSIPEIIDGERSDEMMNQETQETALKLAAYSDHTLHVEKKKIFSYFFMGLGLFVILTALAIFPHESSWASIYCLGGSLVLFIGFMLYLQTRFVKRRMRLVCMMSALVVMMTFFSVSDYISVAYLHQVPIFSYEKEYGDHEVVHKTLFFTAIQKNPGTRHERVYIGTH